MINYIDVTDRLPDVNQKVYGRYETDSGERTGTVYLDKDGRWHLLRDSDSICLTQEECMVTGWRSIPKVTLDDSSPEPQLIV